MNLFLKRFLFVLFPGQCLYTSCEQCLNTSSVLFLLLLGVTNTSSYLPMKNKKYIYLRK